MTRLPAALAVELNISVMFTMLLTNFNELVPVSQLKVSARSRDVLLQCSKIFSGTSTLRGRVTDAPPTHTHWLRPWWLCSCWTLWHRLSTAKPPSSLVRLTWTTGSCCGCATHVIWAGSKYVIWTVVIVSALARSFSDLTVLCHHAATLTRL